MLTLGTRERGFSMIELIIAVALLGIVLGTVATASVINSNESIKSQSKVKLASALEQAVESVHLEQPWLAASGKCASMPCQYTFDVSASERFKFTATVDVTQLDPSTFDVAVALNAYDAGSNTLVAGLRPVRTSFIKDLRKLEHGDVVISSCRVNQADERMAAGSCPIDPTTGVAKQSWTPMVDPHGLPAPSAPNKSGNDWLLPRYQGYGKTSDRVAWEDVRADGRNRIYFYPNTFTATIAGNGINKTLSGNGRVTFEKLPRGTYSVKVSETNGVSTGHVFWDRKSTGHMPPTYPANTYKVVVTPGTQNRVTRLWEPRPVDVEMRVKTGDAAIHWEPRWMQDSVTNGSGKHDRAMLIPFPEGRVDIPGVSNEEFKNCPDKKFKNTFNDLCDKKWGALTPGATHITMKDVRPGLYKAYWYQSYNVDGKWGLKERTISKKDLGFGNATRWNSTFNMHGRVGYVYVNPNGTVSTANSSSWNGATTVASKDDNVAIRYPGCSNRRGILTKLFSEVPDTALEDGSKRWIYHSAATGKVYPPSLWDELSQPLKDELLQYKGDAALGWVKRVDRKKSGGEFYSTYRAAIGGWDDAKTTIGWKWRRVDHMTWSGWYNSPGGQSYANAGYNVEYRTYTYSYVNKKGKTVWVSVPQYRYKYPVYAPNPWEPEPSPANQWINRKDWVLDEPVRKHKWDIIKSKTVFKMTNLDYREPLNNNVLYKNVSEPVGITEFNLFDSCSSNDKEFDSDGDEMS